MKELDLQSEITETLPGMHRIDVPIGKDVRLMILIYGDPDHVNFDHFHKIVSYLEVSMLGTRESAPVLQHDQKKKRIKSRRPVNLWNKRQLICEKHPDSPRMANNRCRACFDEMIADRSSKKIGRLTYTPESGHIEVGCSKRTFYRMIHEVLNRPKGERHTILSVEEIGILKQHWQTNRSQYEIDAEKILEIQLEKTL